MNFTKYFKRKDYDNMDRFLLQQKIRCSRDPFEGDPFKIQSLNFRYADKPKFYPITNRSKIFGNAENPRIKSVYRNQPNCNSFERGNRNFEYSNPSSLMNNGGKSLSVCSIPVIPKTEKCTPSSIANSDANKIGFIRSRSFITPFTEETVISSHPNLLKKNIVKTKNNIETKRRTDSMTAINLDHSGGGCKISIKINGVPSDQVHINDKINNHEIFLNRTKTITKPALSKIESPYELKPSRSYIICKDDTVTDNSLDLRKSSRKLLRECSTHSMIPHKEERSKTKEFTKKSSLADMKNFSRVELKSEPRLRGISQLNLSRKVSQNDAFENLTRKNSSRTQRTLPGMNLEGKAIMLEKIISSNPITAPSKKNFNLKKSKSVLDQRFTPLPIPKKYYTFDNNNSRAH